MGSNTRAGSTPARSTRLAQVATILYISYMWMLNTTSKSIKAKTAVAPTTPLDYVSAWFDQSTSIPVRSGPDNQNGTINNVLAAVVPSPADGVQREVRTININNTDNINHDLTFYFSSGADTLIFQCLLQPGWTLNWDADLGWRIYTELGVEF
jgi:hypothetical protein